MHVGVFGAEERFGSRDGERLDHIDELATAVVAASRIAFRVLVGEHRAGGFEHGAADEILGRDELQAVRLPRRLIADGPRDVGVDVAQRALHDLRQRIQFLSHSTVLSGHHGHQRSGRTAARRRAIELADLVDPSLVTATRKCRVEERLDDVERHGRGCGPRAQRKNVGVVVLAAQARHFGRDDRRGADAGNLVGGDGHADARAADEDAALVLARGHGAGNGRGEIRIVDRVFRLGAEVAIGNPASIQEALDVFLETHPRMIRADRDPHTG